LEVVSSFESSCVLVFSFLFEDSSLLSLSSLFVLSLSSDVLLLVAGFVTGLEPLPSLI
jgi:hypothetical protein